MIVTYSAVDGFSIQATSTTAWLMGDAAADLITSQIANSPELNLTANGTITTSAVATDATTLASSGFSTSNYYSLAYNAAFDPGTAGFSIKGWFIATSTPGSAAIMFAREISGNPSPIGARYYVFMSTSARISVVVDDTAGSTRSTTSPAGTDYANSQWHQFVAVFDGSTIDLYIDGELVSQATGAAMASLSEGTAVLNIGRSANTGSNAFSIGSLAGFEFDIGNQWTAQTVKNIYNLEKILFRQREPFSIVGGSISYEISLSASSISNAVSENFTETLDGTRSGITWYRKREYSCQTIPFARSALGEAEKFLRSTNNATFTFDERGTASAADEAVTVYKTSQNETVQFSNPYYSFSFSVRES